jgi:hypothetical protein
MCSTYKMKLFLCSVLRTVTKGNSTLCFQMSHIYRTATNFNAYSHYPVRSPGAHHCLISNVLHIKNKHYYEKYCILPGYYRVGSGNFLPMFWTTYWSHLQESRIQQDSWLSEQSLYMKSVGGDKLSAVWC